MTTTDQMHAEVYRAWILALRDEFEELKYKGILPWTLAMPNFCINSSSTVQLLGSWNTQTRQLSLSARLFENCDWDNTLTVLKHEIAHQLVAEHFGVHHEDAHGPTFVRACGMLGIDPQAKQQLTFVPHGNHPVIGKIHKLMALGESPNHHEAEAALSKAHALMLKYNLEHLKQSNGDQYAFRMLAPVHLRIPSYFWSVMAILGKYYFVEYISRPFNFATEPGRNGPRVIEIYGTPANLDMAEFVYYFLLQQGEREWEIQRKTMGLKGRVQRASFLRGLYSGVSERLRSEREHLAQDEALVWSGDPGLKAYYRRRNPSVVSTGSRLKNDVQAQQAGHAIGTQLRIRRGVTDGPSNEQRQLRG